MKKTKYFYYHLLAFSSIIIASIVFFLIATTTQISYNIKIRGFAYSNQFYGEVISNLDISHNLLYNREITVVVNRDTLLLTIRRMNVVDSNITIEGVFDDYSTEILVPLEFNVSAPVEKPLGSIIFERVFKKFTKS